MERYAGPFEEPVDGARQQERHYQLLSALQSLVKELPSSFQQRLSYTTLSDLALALLDGTVFEIVQGLLEIQHLTEKSLYNQRLRLQNEHRGLCLGGLLAISVDVPWMTIMSRPGPMACGHLSPEASKSKSPTPLVLSLGCNPGPSSTPACPASPSSALHLPESPGALLLEKGPALVLRQALRQKHQEAQQACQPHNLLMLQAAQQREQEAVEHRIREEQRAMDQKIVLELDRKVADQQSTLEKAGVAGFYVTTNPQELMLQMNLLELIRKLQQRGCQAGKAAL